MRDSVRIRGGRCVKVEIRLALRFEEVRTISFTLIHSPILLPILEHFSFHYSPSLQAERPSQNLPVCTQES